MVTDLAASRGLNNEAEQRMPTIPLSGQQVGALGIAWATYECARRGWNALVTTRHRAGPDLWVDVGEGLAVPVQVKAVTTKRGRTNNVHLGSVDREGDESVLVVVVVEQTDGLPVVKGSFVMGYAEAASQARTYQGTRWLQAADFQRDDHREAWDLLHARAS